MNAEDKLVVPLLDVDNYATWKTRMKCLLVIKNLWGVVAGASSDVTSDQKALALIGLYVKDHHLSMVESCSTSKEAWEKLEAIYQAKSNARKRQLRKDLSQLKMGMVEPVTKYVARAKEIQNQLRAAGHEVADQEVAWAILAGLRKEFDTVVTVLETNADKDITLDEMLPKLMSAEQRMEEQEFKVKEEATALAAKHFKETRKCYKCGMKGHIAKNCRLNAQMMSAIAL